MPRKKKDITAYGNPHNLEHLHEKIDQHGTAITSLQTDMGWVKEYVKKIDLKMLGLFIAVIAAAIASILL